MDLKGNPNKKPVLVRDESGNPFDSRIADGYVKILSSSKAALYVRATPDAVQLGYGSEEEENYFHFYFSRATFKEFLEKLIQETKTG